MLLPCCRTRPWHTTYSAVYCFHGFWVTARYFAQCRWRIFRWDLWALKSRQLLNIDKSQISRLFGVVNSKYCFSKNVDIALCFLHISLTNIIFSSLSLLSVKSTTYKIDSLVTIYACQRNRIYMWVPQLCCCLSQLKGWPMILRGCNRARPAVFPARPLWFFYQLSHSVHYISI